MRDLCLMFPTLHIIHRWYHWRMSWFLAYRVRLYNLRRLPCRYFRWHGALNSHWMLGVSKVMAWKFEVGSSEQAFPR